MSISPGPPQPPVDPTRDFTALYQAHYAKVLAYAQRRVDSEAARDVTAETFTIAWRRGGEPAIAAALASPTAQLPWLYATARRVLANQLRRDAHRHHLDLTAVAAATAGVPVVVAGRVLGQVAGQVIGQVPVVVDIATGVGERDALTRALAHLSPRDQEALQLAVWEELTPAHAAEVIGCSVTAYKVRLHRARRRLENALRLEEHPAAAPARTTSRPTSRGDDRRSAPAASPLSATSQEQQ